MNRPKTDNLPASNRTALIIGDAMVDTYMDCAPVGISDEAPVMVLDWRKTHRTFGGVLNAAKSLAALGFNVHAVGAVNADDDAGQFVHDECARLGIAEHWHTDGRPTIEKSRVRTDPAHPPIEQIARVDVEHDEPLDRSVQSAMHAETEALLKDADVVLVSDYIKGVMTRELAARLVQRARERKIPLLIDAKPSTLAWYAGATIIKPNEREARDFLAMSRFDLSAAATEEMNRDDLARALADALRASILLTCAGDGMYLCDRTDDEARPVGRIHPPEIDFVESTSGAGDVVMAVLALGAALGEAWETAAEWAMQCAAMTIARGGTCALEKDDDLTSILTRA